jgi:hypothetical protein
MTAGKLSRFELARWWEEHQLKSAYNIIFNWFHDHHNAFYHDPRENVSSIGSTDFCPAEDIYVAETPRRIALNQAAAAETRSALGIGEGEGEGDAAGPNYSVSPISVIRNQTVVDRKGNLRPFVDSKNYGSVSTTPFVEKIGGAVSIAAPLLTGAGAYFNSSPIYIHVASNGAWYATSDEYIKNDNHSGYLTHEQAVKELRERFEALGLSVPSF